MKKIDPAVEVRKSISESAFLSGLEGARALLGRGRELTEDEVKQLKKARNRASDWNKVRVAENARLDPDRIQDCQFLDEVIIGSLEGEAMLGDVAFPTGIYDSTLSDCVVCDGALVKNVGLMHRIIVREKAVVASCGEVSCPKGCVFGNGTRLPVAVDTGGREVLTYAELAIPIVEAITHDNAEDGMLSAYAEAVQEYLARARSDWMVVSEGARVTNTQAVKGVFVGAHACIDGATLIENATILSNEQERTSVVGGAYVSDSILQWGCQVAMLAMVKNSIVTKASLVQHRRTVVDRIEGLGTSRVAVP